VWVQPFSGGPTRKWKGESFEKDHRRVDPNGFRLLEHAKPEQINTWLKSASVDLLNAILLDELARGQEGLKRSVLRTYLSDYLEGDQLEELIKQANKLLETATDFDSKGEGTNLIFVASVGSSSTNARMVERFDKLRLWHIPARSKSIDDKAEIDEQLNRIGQLLAIPIESEDAILAQSDERSHATTAAGRIVGDGHGLLPDAAIANIEAQLLGLIEQPGGWGQLSHCVAAAQCRIITLVESPKLLAEAVWYPNLSSKSRRLALERYTELEPNDHKLLRVECRGANSTTSSHAKAIDAAVGGCPDPHRLAPLAIHRLSALSDTSWMEGSKTPNLSGLLDERPYPTVLGWLVDLFSEGIRPNIEKLRKTINALVVDGPDSSTDLDGLLRVLGAGALLWGSRSGQFTPFAKLCSPARLERLTQDYFSDLAERSQEVLVPHIEALFACEPLGNGARKASAEELHRLLQESRNWHESSRLFLQFADHTENLSAELQEANRLSNSLDHARLLLNEAQATDNEEIARRIKAGLLAESAENDRKQTVRHAEVLAGIMTALQQAAQRTEDENAQRLFKRLESKLEKMVSLRLKWSFISRFSEPIPTEPGLCEVQGESGAPYVAVVGIQRIDEGTKEVLLRAIAFRRNAGPAEGS